MRRWVAEGVERARTIASKNHGFGKKILHRETEGVKFNRRKIIDDELSNKNKVFDDVRNNKNIAEEKIFGGEGKGVRAGVSNRKRCTIAYYNFM
jgi:hypothetical protein